MLGEAFQTYELQYMVDNMGYETSVVQTLRDVRAKVRR